MRAHWRKEEWVLRLLYFWAGSCYTFFLSCVTIRTNFLKCFAVCAVGNALQHQISVINVVSNLIWVRSWIMWQVRLTRKNCWRSISVGDILTQTWREHCHVFTWTYAIHFIPTNMVRTRVRGNLRKQNTKTTVPLDVVPERRTERCSPRFRPGGRFCELRFRYLSSPTGREGEISRPLDHMRQIPFIHSARLIDSTNFYIYRTVF